MSAARRRACVAALASAACSSGTHPPNPTAPTNPPPGSASAAPVAPQPVTSVESADGASADQHWPDVISVTPLQGPFARLEDFCKQERDRGWYQARCVFAGSWAKEIARPRGVIRAARHFVVHRGTVTRGPLLSHEIALRTTAGWFVYDAPYSSVGRSPAGVPRGVTVSTEELSWSDDGEVVLSVARTSNPRNGWWRGLNVCGVGPSGVPSCSWGIAIGCTLRHGPEQELDASPTERRWRYEDGWVEIEGERCGDDPQGRRRVVFP